MSAERRLVFAAHLPWDRYAFPAFVIMVWAAILMGFVPEIIGQLRTHEFDYPPATHVHAALAFGWLALLTVQTGLVRVGNLALHRRLGIIGTCLVPLMVVVGFVVVISMFRRLYAPDFLPMTLSLRFADLTLFGGLAGAALYLRRDPPAHKRLMLLAAFTLASAGFGRWWGDAIVAVTGPGYFGVWAFDYLGVALLILALGAFDLATRRRLHPAFVIGAIAIWSLGLLSIYVRYAPWWRPISMNLIGH